MAIDRDSLPQISDNIKQFWQPQRIDHSAGGIAYRFTPASEAEFDGACRSDGFGYEARLVLISTHGGNRWQLPKGTVEATETPIETAIREVEEESGLKTAHDRFVETVEYWYWDTFNKRVATLVHKKVDFYLLRVIGGELSDESIEVDAVGWFTPLQALKRMTFQAERETLRKALGEIEG